MEIVKVENMEQMTGSNVYYEIAGKFYARCWNCGKPVALDHRRTAADLHRDEEGEEMFFCSGECCRKYINSEGIEYDFEYWNGKEYVKYE